MNLALIVGPSGAAIEEAGAPSRALGGKLREGGYRVEHLPLSNDIDATLRAAFADAGGDVSLLVYLAGTVDLEAAHLCLRVPGGGPPFDLIEVGELVRARSSGESLIILDLGHDEPDADAMRAAEYVQAAIDAFDARRSGIEMLIAAGPLGASATCWPFTRLLVEALADPSTRDATGVTTAGRVCALLRASGILAERVPGFAHVKAEREFPLLRGAPIGQPLTPSPPASASAPASSRGPISAPRSGTSVEALAAEGEAALGREDWETAAAAYKKALMLTPLEEGERRATIYLRYGDVKRRQGKPREAELNFEKVLEIDRKSAAAHDALIHLAEEAKDHRRVLTLRRRAREAREDPSQLVLIADVLENDLDDLKSAIVALEEARAILPGDVGVLGRLRRIYEAKEWWRKLVDVLGELALAATSPKGRAAERFAQADVALGRLLDEERGLAWLEAAIDDDPAHDKALAALVAVRTRRKEWAPLDATYASLVDRFAVAGDVEGAWATCRRMGLLRRDLMGDARGAVDAFQGAIRCKPGDVESRAALADLRATLGDLDGSLGELLGMTRLDPLRVATYRKLYDLHTRAGRTDRAWLAATALEELGAADIDHHLVVDQYRAGGMQVVSPSAVFAEHTWRERLRAQGADSAVAAILRAVGRPAAEMRVSSLKKEKKLLSLSPARRQAETSTASIVRTFVWASRVLDVSLPELYVYDDVPGGLAAVQGDARATAIGPAVLTGLPVPELAFVVARHLTYYRPEHYALVFYPTIPELHTLFLSAVEIGLPEMPVSSRTGAIGKKQVHSLERLLTDKERDDLSLAAASFAEGGGRVDLAGWIRGVELTATRAGFALAGDLAVAMRVMRRETRTIADVPLDDKRADLLAYSASDAFAMLREELSLTARAGAF